MNRIDFLDKVFKPNWKYKKADTCPLLCVERK